MQHSPGSLKSTPGRWSYPVLLGLALLLAAPAPVAADETGPFFERGRDRHAGVDEYFSEFCGFTIRYSADFAWQIRRYANGARRIHIRSRVAFRSPWKTLIAREAYSSYQRHPAVTVFYPEAGIEVTTYRLTVRGLNVQLVQPGRGVVLRDAGRLTYTLVEELHEDGYFEAYVTDVDMRGPHPSSRMDPLEWIERFCAALR